MKFSLPISMTAVVSALSLPLALGLLIGPHVVHAFDENIADPIAKGLAISQEAVRRDTGFDNYTVSFEMVLRNRHGAENRRNLRSKVLEKITDGDWSLIVFDNPRAVKGTALLSYTHKHSDDDQWLFLPAAKRVKRIASSNKSGPFMGSEFAFEDLASQEIEKYDYKYIRDDEIDGKAMFVIERDPIDPKSGYSWQVVWMDKEEFIPHKIEFYDRKKSHLKTLTFAGYQQYLEQYWRADQMVMVNHQTGKSTDLLWSNYQFRQQLTENEFTKEALKRVK